MAFFKIFVMFRTSLCPLSTILFALLNSLATPVWSDLWGIQFRTVPPPWEGTVTNSVLNSPDTCCPLLEILWLLKFFPCRELGYGRPLLLPLHLLLLLLCLGPFLGLCLPCRCFGTVELLRGQEAILMRNPPGYLSLPGILLETCAVLPVEWMTVCGTQISNACIMCSRKNHYFIK